MNDIAIQGECEKWYSNNREWARSIERDSSGEHKYPGAAMAWPVWRSATKHVKTEALAHLLQSQAGCRAQAGAA